MASKRVERAKAKTELATGLAAIGGAAGTAIAPGVGTGIGLAAGGLAGLIIGDSGYVFPIDFIAIPAFQAHYINPAASVQVYIKAGETLIPTGNQVMDTDVSGEDLNIIAANIEGMVQPKRRAKGAGLPKKYAKMGFKKGWAAYNKTPKRKAAKKKAAAKKRRKR